MIEMRAESAYMRDMAKSRATQESTVEIGNNAAAWAAPIDGPRDQCRCALRDGQLGAVTLWLPAEIGRQ